MAVMRPAAKSGGDEIRRKKRRVYFACAEPQKQGPANCVIYDGASPTICLKAREKDEKKEQIASIQRGEGGFLGDS